MGKPYHELTNEEKTPVHLDAGENCDWPKRTWDLGPPTAKNMTWVLYSIIACGFPKTKDVVQQRLDLFMTTPAGRGMPQEHRKRIRDLGYTIKEGA